MTDLEMVRLCARAMGLDVYEMSGYPPENTILIAGARESLGYYWPLTNKAQAFELMVALRMTVAPGIARCDEGEAFEHGDDEAATMRAIVRAATLIAQSKAGAEGRGE